MKSRNSKIIKLRKFMRGNTKQKKLQLDRVYCQENIEEKQLRIEGTYTASLGSPQWGPPVGLDYCIRWMYDVLESFNEHFFGGADEFQNGLNV